MPPERHPAFWLAATGSFFLGLATSFTLGAALIPANAEVPHGADSAQPGHREQVIPTSSDTPEIQTLRRLVQELQVELAISRELGSGYPEVTGTREPQPRDTRPGHLVAKETPGTLTPPPDHSEATLLAEMLAPIPRELATRSDLLMVLFRHYLELGDEVRAMVALAELQRQDVDESVFQSCLDYLPPHLRVPLLRRLAEGSKDDEVWGNLGDLYTEMGNSVLAQEAYDRALQLDPSDGEWLDALAATAPWKVLKILEQRAAENPGDFESIGTLAQAYHQSGRTGDAVALLEQMLPQAPGEVISALIEIDPNRAAQLIEKRLEVAADDASAWNQLGGAYQALGRQAEAAEAWWRALALEPANEDACQALLAHDASRLLGFYEQRLLDPEHAGNDEIWGDLGDTFAHLGREGDALRCYQRARELDPEDGEWEQKAMGEFNGNPSLNGATGRLHPLGNGGMLDFDDEDLDLVLPREKGRGE